ncbi:MAG: glycosyltransferase family A protein [Ilumatobacteraceae bacterium]
MFERAKRLIIDRLGIGRIAAHADELDAEVRHLRAVRDDLLREVSRLRADLADLEPAARWARIHTVSAWCAEAPLLHEPRISIVLATRNRADLLQQAIDSVMAQTYPDWQLVVVDDGSTDATTTLLAALDDERIVTSRTTGIGAAAARNRGLELVTGDYVTFLDDDNVMAAGWLRAVAEYTGRHPECEVLYGAQVRQVEPDEPDAGSVAGLYLLFVDPFDPDRLRDHNYVDLGVIVVRRGHAELHFDEQLDIYIDWELFVRLARATPPHPLPVLASFYRTVAPTRITSSHDRDERIAAMQRRFASPTEA